MKNLKTFFLLLISSSALLWGCKSDEIISVIIPPHSDLTRSGKFISFTSNKDGNYDIFIAQVDASGNLVTDSSQWVYPDNPHNLTNSAGTDKQSNWSPNGRILVYSSNELIYAFFFKSDGSIDPGITPNPHLVGPTDINWHENPQFSPDGLYLVWDRRQDNNSPPGIDTADSRDLFRANVNYGSNGDITISNILVLTDTTDGKDKYDPKWSPRISVRRIAYTLGTSATATDHEVWIMDPLNPSTNAVFYNPNRNGYPAWSPACDRIYFETDHGNGGFYFIGYLSYPNPTGDPIQLVQSSTQNLRYPTRLPNGNLLAYIRIDGTGNGNIWVHSTLVLGGDGNKLIPSSYGFDPFNNLWPAW